MKVRPETRARLRPSLWKEASLLETMYFRHLRTFKVFNGPSLAEVTILGVWFIVHQYLYIYISFVIRQITFALYKSKSQRRDIYRENGLISLNMNRLDRVSADQA